MKTANGQREGAGDTHSKGTERVRERERESTVYVVIVSFCLKGPLVRTGHWWFMTLLVTDHHHIVLPLNFLNSLY